MHITPYLYFEGTCCAAFAHYQRVLGGELMLTTYAQMPPHAGSQVAINAAAADLVMHVTLAGSDGPRLMGSDMPPGQRLQGAKPVSVGLGFDDTLEAERAYAALAEGGQVQMPFGETFWAEGFGMCTDRFGIQWLVNGRDRSL
ncbi:VOC family protein [Xanthomonas vesicatoria]|uniref:VOC family protein n=1 Tax=Xanthomonas vesicatoria TaxID=56460 RepID=UPI0024124D5F|nr:VOC family protein [Xanthomonas vesicatoria]MDG4489436.1 VOC family protein [Xanthomonas vesicatoria]